jgi:hypothetical protein
MLISRRALDVRSVFGVDVRCGFEVRKRILRSLKRV